MDRVVQGRVVMHLELDITLYQVLLKDMVMVTHNLLALVLVDKQERNGTLLLVNAVFEHEGILLLDKKGARNTIIV